MNKLLTPLAVLLTLALVAALLVEQRQAQKFDLKIGELNRELLKSREECKQLGAKAAAAEAQQKQFQAESESLRERLHTIAQQTPPPNPDAAPSPTPEEPRNPFPGMMKKMMADPQMKKAMAQQQTMALRQSYSAFIKEAGLTPQEADKLFELLGKRTESLMEVAANPGDPNPPKVNLYSEEFKALLGDQRASLFKEFEKSLPDRMAITQVNQALADSNSQLNDSQTRSLLQIFSEERAHSSAAPISPAPGQPMNSEQIDHYIKEQTDLNQRITIRASSILTPQQMEQFQASQKQQLEMQKMGLKMAEQMLSPAKSQ